MRRFESKEGSSNKFWEVSVSGNTLTVRFGRAGGRGQEKLKTFASATLAEKEQDKLVAEKLGKGYKEVGPTGADKSIQTTAASKAASQDSFLSEVRGSKALENV